MLGACEGAAAGSGAERTCEWPKSTMFCAGPPSLIEDITMYKYQLFVEDLVCARHILTCFTCIEVLNFNYAIGAVFIPIL